MTAGETAVRLVLDTGDGDEERAEEEIRYLLAEVEELGVERVERAALGPPPAGARADAAFELGALVVALGGSGALLPALVGLARDWIARRRSGTIRITIGDDTLELTATTDAMGRRALEEFLRRHDPALPALEAGPSSDAAAGTGSHTGTGTGTHTGTGAGTAPDPR
jgi:hypothetical protein